MALENIYTEVNFKNESGTNSDSSTDLTSVVSLLTPKKKILHKSNPGFPTLLLALLMIFFLLLAILFSVALVILFRMYSDLLEEKNTIKQLNYTKLECIKNHSPMEVWSCCLKNWKPLNFHCYFISTGSKSWSESEENCASMGAHLLVICSKEEQDFITMNLDTHAAYYVGLSDPEGQGQWQWVDQTPYNSNATFWLPGDLNCNKEYCVVLNHHLNIRGWGWNNVSCDSDHRSVCELMKIYL
uniref:C-type lectin domain family 4, member a1 n=1 Tax=Nannospalax galili TaxID=1026970 RepID=A0A8C6RX29_NANGA